MSEKLDIYSKIFYRDVEKFVRYLCLLVLRHQMRVSNYFVNSFYSVKYVSCFKGTVQPDWICMRVVSLESPLKGHQLLYVLIFYF